MCMSLHQERRIYSPGCNPGGIMRSQRPTPPDIRIKIIKSVMHLLFPFA